MISNKDKRNILDIFFKLVGNTNLSVMKSILIRNKQNVMVHKSGKDFLIMSIYCRLRLFLFLLKSIFSIFFKFKDNSHNNYFVESVSISPEVNQLWVEKLELYGFKKSIKQGGYCKSKLCLPQVEMLLFFLKAILISPIVLFCSNHVNNIIYHSLSHVLFCAKLPKGANVAFFRGHKENIYIASYIASSFLHDLNIYLILDDGAIFPTRYTYLPKVNLLGKSSLHTEEVNSYEKRNWYVYKKLINSQDEIVNPDNFKYDISLYSSGFWARYSDGGRMSSKELKKGMINTENTFYKEFLDLLNYVSDISSRNDFTVKLYLHPFEKECIRLGCQLPFLELLNKNVVVEDVNEENMDRLGESKVGVSILSTISFDRWHRSLDSVVMMFGNSSIEKEWVNEKYMGKYERFFVRNSENLEEILKEIIKKEDGSRY